MPPIIEKNNNRKKMIEIERKKSNRKKWSKLKEQNLIENFEKIKKIIKNWYQNKSAKKLSKTEL